MIILRSYIKHHEVSKYFELGWKKLTPLLPSVHLAKVSQCLDIDTPMKHSSSCLGYNVPFWGAKRNWYLEFHVFTEIKKQSFDDNIKESRAIFFFLTKQKRQNELISYVHRVQQKPISFHSQINNPTQYTTDRDKLRRRRNIEETKEFDFFL